MSELLRPALREAAQAWYTEPERRRVARGVDSRLSRTARRLAFEVALDRLGRDPSRVLDVGCGDGEGLEDLRARLPGSTFVGLEPEPGMAALAARRLGGDVCVLREPAAPGRLGSVNADLVLCHLTLALWDEPVDGLRGLAEALAPGTAASSTTRCPICSTSTASTKLRSTSSRWGARHLHLERGGRVTSGLLIAVVLWPACWHALARRLRSRQGMSRARQLAAVVGYDVLSWAWAILLLGFLPAMTARLEGIGAGVELAVAALAGAALYAALARGRLRGILRGLRPDRRVVTQGVVFALTATAEEVIFRGFLLAALVVDVGLPAGVALLASAAVFALVHVDAHGRRAAVTHLVTGAVFGAVFVTTGSVTAAAVCHVTYNLGVLGAKRSRRRARSSVRIGFRPQGHVGSGS